jgi:thioredoxin 1
MSANVKYFSDSDFESMVLKNKKPVLVDFWAEWCMPCRMLGMEIEKLADEKSDVLVVGKLNVDENPQISMNYQVMRIPTMILFKNGQEVKRIVGAKPKDQIFDEIRDTL